jgi:hypothetical protein
MDELKEIKATLRHWDAMYAQHGLAPLPPAVAAQESARHVNRAQIDWLVEQAELAMELGDLLPKKILTITRLRGLLKRLEWSHDAYEGSGGGACPVCYGGGVHSPDCWLAKELTHNDETAPPKEGGTSQR